MKKIFFIKILLYITLVAHTSLAEEYIRLLPNNSLFFLEQEIEDIEDILQNKNPVLLPIIEKKEVKKKQILKKEYSFFLDSILYFGKNRWSIWLNGQKINNKKSKNNIKIHKINKDYVQFKFTSSVLGTISIVKKLIKERSLPKNVTAIIKNNRAIIHFILYPNQTFLLNEKLFIKEGKI